MGNHEETPTPPGQKPEEISTSKTSENLNDKKLLSSLNKAAAEAYEEFSGSSSDDFTARELVEREKSGEILSPTEARLLKIYRRINNAEKQIT